MESLAKDYGAEIDWNVGCLSSFSNSMLGYLHVLRQNNYEIPTFKYAFGGPTCKFSGGRALHSYPVTPALIASTIEAYGEFDIACRFTFQNTELTKEDLSDPYSNSILECLASCNPTKRNGVIVYSDLLTEYIRDKYPSLELVSSLVKPAVEVGLIKDTPKYYNKLLKRYNTVVVNASRVFDEGFLDALDDVSRIEVIVNSKCIKNCPFAAQHYKQLSKDNIFWVDSGFAIRNENRDNIMDKCLPLKQKDGGRRMLVMDDNQIKYLVDKGVRHFKLEGREYSMLEIVTDLACYACNYYVAKKFSSDLFPFKINLASF